MEVTSVVEELAIVHGYSGWSWIGTLIALVLVGMLLFRLIAIPAEYLWSKGYDPNKNLLLVQRFFRFLFIFSMFIYVVGKIYDKSKEVAVYSSILFLAIALFSQKDSIGNLISGFLSIFDSRIKVGKRLACGSHQGIIRSVRLLNVELESDDGELIFIPHSLLFSEPVAVVGRSGGHPIEIEVDCDGTVVTQSLLKQMALASPYRKSSSKVEIEQLTFESPIKFEVRFYVWSPGVINQARQHFYNNFNQIQEQAATSAPRPVT